MRHRGARLAETLRLLASNPGSSFRGIVRLPHEQRAARRIASLPQVHLTELAGGHRQEIPLVLAPPDSRHSWSLGEAEQICLQVLIKARACFDVFEIGTFNGGTTRMMAESLPASGHVHTLDLPPAEFDGTQRPTAFSGVDVGRAYADSPSRAQVTQLYGNSLSFDFGPYERSADIVLVDGGHEYAHGLSDSRAALRIVRPGGLVLWDDFEPYWHGLVNGICDAMKDRNLGRLAGTALAVHRADTADVDTPHPSVTR